MSTEPNPVIGQDFELNMIGKDKDVALIYHNETVGQHNPFCRTGEPRAGTRE